MFVSRFTRFCWGNQKNEIFSFLSSYILILNFLVYYRKSSSDIPAGQQIRCTPDWGENAVSGDHLWVPISVSGDSCYVGDNDCLVSPIFKFVFSRVNCEFQGCDEKTCGGQGWWMNFRSTSNWWMCWSIIWHWEIDSNFQWNNWTDHISLCLWVPASMSIKWIDWVSRGYTRSRIGWMEC